ncbi:Cytochrome c551 peroxidase precursor [Planctomycetes bacterium Poly30]|uniref:Cytochrome c551 peroxidase n=1 Tax=Saltatorellus ferox TaxID=2528018 RepID=A0A518F149_9BACT|nr:Cytochrome c551 peroxidase precursor [Planctomycetes bacterium Poly30]
MGDRERSGAISGGLAGGLVLLLCAGMGAGMGTGAVLASAQAGQSLPRKAEGPDDRPLIPEDTLPTPFVRSVSLGIEPLAEGFTASEEEFALGRRLFFDPILSVRRTVACASCHRPEFAFADNRKTSRGIENYLTRRNSPSLLNKGLDTHVLWDGRAATLEEQVLMPIENPEEMALGTSAAVNRLSQDSDYPALFQAVYGREVDADALASALSAFVRGLTVGNSPVDRFRDGDVTALDPSEEAGLWLYEGRGRCWQCHNGPNFADGEFHNTGIGASDGVPEEGRYFATSVDADRGAFRTPGLRMLTLTAPYMHDGSLATLEEVVEFYRRGGHPNSHLSERIQPIRLSDEDAANLVAFLKALSRE